jgi:hypothetical protein
MNHSIFGQSKPVVYATRGVAGAVALPVVVGVGAVAGTAFLTYKAGRFVRKAHKSRKRRKQLVRRCHAATKKHGQNTAVPLSASTPSSSPTSEKLLKTNLIIPPVLDVEISFALLKRQTRGLGEQVALRIENGPSVGAKFQFLKFSLYEGLLGLTKNYKDISAKIKKHGNIPTRLRVTRLRDETCAAIGTLMLQLTEACFELKDNQDASLNPHATFTYDSKTDTYTSTIKTDATTLFPCVQALLPKFLNEIRSGSGKPGHVRGMKVLQSLLVSSGAAPSAYVQQLVLSFFKEDQRGIETVVLEWFKLIRSNVEGDSLEWLLRESWLHKTSLETWCDSSSSCPGPPQILADTAKLLAKNPAQAPPQFWQTLQADAAQHLARYCIGALMFHYDDLVYQCQLGGDKEGQTIDLFDVGDLTGKDHILLPSARQFERVVDHPFATGCMLQYLTSRHQKKFAFDISSGQLFKGGLCESLYKEEDIWKTLCSTLSMIYDSSHTSYLRAMCFQYAQMVFHQLGFEGSQKSLRNLYPNQLSQVLTGENRSATCRNSQCDRSLESSNMPFCHAHAHLQELGVPAEDVKANILKVGEVEVDETTLAFRWKQLFHKLNDACLAVMLHQSTSMHTKTRCERWMLPSACGCFHSMYYNARVLLNLTGASEQLDYGGSSYRMRVSSARAQRADNEARHTMIGLFRGSIDEALLRKLNGELMRCGSKNIYDADQKKTIRKSTEWVVKMYRGQEWLVIEKLGIQYFVSFDGQVRSELPENCTVAWNVSVGDAWIQKNSWVKKKFPMLISEYYVRPELLSPPGLREFPQLIHGIVHR